MKLKTLALTVSLAMGLAACNGSSSDSSTSSTSSNYDFQVTAIDGYLKNAVVTVQCGDQTFTAALTDEHGQTKVDTHGIPSSQCSVTISAASDGSTTDMETGQNFSAGDLYLRVPAGLSGDLVATPLTTLVALKLESGEATSLEDAISQVALEYDIPDTLISSDFVASNEPKARQVALQVVALMPFLPKTESDYKNLTKTDAKTQRDELKTKLAKVNTATKQAIAAAINDGVALNSVYFHITMDTSGNVSVAVMPVTNSQPSTGGTATGATGGTGGTGVGGGTGN